MKIQAQTTMMLLGLMLLITTLIAQPITDSTRSEFEKSLLGKPLPPIQLMMMNGQTFASGKLKDKVLVITFWSVDNSESIMQFSQLNKLKKKYEQQVVFLAIAFEDRKQVAAALDIFQIDIAVAPAGKNLCSALNIREFPKTLFVDRNGIVQAVEEGLAAKLDADGTLLKVDGKIQWELLERYSVVLEGMMR